MNEEITLKYKKSDCIEFSLIWLFVVFPFLLEFIITKRIPFIVIAVLSIFLGILFLISMTKFYVTVIDDKFSYRKKLKKHGSFYVGDISDIFCESNKSFFLTITTVDGQELYLNIGMENFDVLSGYLLEKISSVEINESAVTSNDIAELKKYRDGVYKPKKK